MSINPASMILEKLKLHHNVSLEDFDGKGEWFRVSGSIDSGGGSSRVDHHLYQTLKGSWRSIAGPIWNQCALLLALNGEHAGLWVHIWPLRESRIFEPGPDQVHSLD
jgi:hypothetical protein